MNETYLQKEEASVSVRIDVVKLHGGWIWRSVWYIVPTPLASAHSLRKNSKVTLTPIRLLDWLQQHLQIARILMHWIYLLLEKLRYNHDCNTVRVPRVSTLCSLSESWAHHWAWVHLSELEWTGIHSTNMPVRTNILSLMKNMSKVEKLCFLIIDRVSR